MNKAYSTITVYFPVLSGISGSTVKVRFSFPWQSKQTNNVTVTVLSSLEHVQLWGLDVNYRSQGFLMLSSHTGCPKKDIAKKVLFWPIDSFRFLRIQWICSFVWYTICYSYLFEWDLTVFFLYLYGHENLRESVALKFPMRCFPSIKKLRLHVFSPRSTVVLLYNQWIDSHGQLNISPALFTYLENLLIDIRQNWFPRTFFEIQCSICKPTKQTHLLKNFSFTCRRTKLINDISNKAYRSLESKENKRCSKLGLS